MGREKKSEGALWSRPWVYAARVKSPSVHYVAFFLNWIFLGRSSWARVWIFRFFGFGLCSGGILHEGREIWGIVKKTLKSTLNGLDFGVLITSVYLLFRLGLEFCSWIGLTFGDRRWIKLGNLILVGWIFWVLTSSFIDLYMYIYIYIYILMNWGKSMKKNEIKLGILGVFLTMSPIHLFFQGIWFDLWLGMSVLRRNCWIM